MKFVRRQIYSIVNRSKRSKSTPQHSGYSLLEILVVLAIISSLAVLVGPRLLGHVDRSKVVSTQAQAKQLKQALTIFRMQTGRFPTSQEGLEALIKAPNGNFETWGGPYLDDDKLPQDGWGNEFKYEPPATGAGGAALPKVFSLGADDAPGGEGIAEDIYG